MCGICGIVGGADQAALGRMMDTLRHRGPDDEGRHTDERAGVALGHLRLSVIDVAGGHQPMLNEDGSLALVFNGEIYNHPDLRRELEKKGHRFKTRSDTEVIVHLYEEEGERPPERLRGRFAFAVWDAQRRELFLARDRLGVKPLFCAERRGRFVFASELKAMLAETRDDPEIDPAALDLYLAFMHVPAPHTLVKGVYKLPPGHTATIRQGRARLRRYWEIPEPAAAKPPRALRSAAADVCDLLREAVRERLMSEVPLGAYLSGGLDSSLIVALMSEVSPSPETFSVGFDEAAFDETRWAERVAGRFGARHHRLRCRHGGMERLRRVFWHLDEPVADAAAIPTFLMAETTKPRATVTLTGEGADEVFAGYSHYKVLTAGAAAGRWAPLGPVGGLGSGLAGRALAFGASVGSPSAAYLALKSVFTPGERRELVRSDMHPPDGAPGPREIVAPYLDEGRGDYLQRLLRLDLATWLPDDLLVKVDRMTMAHGVEARVPYLDYRLVEAAMALPSDWKLRGGVSKYLLRYAAEGRLPRDIAWRRKQGFGVPVEAWAGADLRGLVEDALGADSVSRRGWLRPSVVSRLLARRPFTLFRRRQFWTLFALEMWAREVFDRPGKP